MWLEKKTVIDFGIIPDEKNIYNLSSRSLGELDWRFT